MSNAGTILRVDLTEGKIERDLTSSYVRDYVGGLSIGTKILWDGVPPEITGTDPKNMLIFSTGPLTGTLLGNKCVLIAKSPIYTNKTIGNAGMGGQFPSEMKFAGYDHIVITGKADEPAYLFINNDDVEIKNAKHLWGLDVYETQTRIKKELKDPDVQIACIGPAGENLVAFSLVLHDIENTASRVGHGAVMGSKNLKAVAVRGTKGLKVADPEAFMALWKQYYEYYTAGRGRYIFKALNREGVAIHYDHYVDKDTAVWGNFDSFVVPNRKKEEEISDFMNKYLAGRIGCAFCPAQCHENYNVDGVGGGATCMFYTGFRWVVKNKNLKTWWKLNQLCQRYGMETLSASGITAWLMDLYERGIITAAA
jgi:aldehyde:ferredoxin oxidoreductase